MDTLVKISSIKKPIIHLNPGKIHIVHFSWSELEATEVDSPMTAESHGQLQGTQVIVGKAAEELMQNHI